MSRKIEVTLYTFKELNDKAKEKARAWWRELSAEDSLFSEGPKEDLKEVAKHMGWKVTDTYFSGFSSQGDGACFAGEWAASRVNVASLKGYAPKDEELHRIVAIIERVATRNPEAIASVRQSGHYMHENCTRFEYEDFSDAYRDEDEKLLTKATRDLMQWFYASLEEASEFEDSDKNIDEILTNNEQYEFTADGEAY